MRIADEDDVLEYLKKMYTIEEIADELIESKNMIRTIVKRLKDNGRWIPGAEKAKVKEKIQALIIDGRTLEQIIDELGSQGININFIKDNYKKIKKDNKVLGKRKMEKSYERAMEMAQSGQYTIEEIIAECGEMTIPKTDNLRYTIIKNMYRQRRSITEISEKVGLSLQALNKLIELWGNLGIQKGDQEATEEETKGKIQAREA